MQVTPLRRTQLPFVTWTGMGQRNHVLDGVQSAACQGAIFSGKDMPRHARRHSTVSCAEMAEPIEMPFGLWTLVGPRNHVLGGSAHWCHLVNNAEPSMCGGDAAFLSNYF